MSQISEWFIVMCCASLEFETALDHLHHEITPLYVTLCAFPNDISLTLQFAAMSDQGRDQPAFDIITVVQQTYRKPPVDRFRIPSGTNGTVVPMCHG